ncbi:MAG: lysoplasmalogenase [Leptospirales bacterium]|nr:lysoplasmalogenase [Leptospirales bacterium]
MNFPEVAFFPLLAILALVFLVREYSTFKGILQLRYLLTPLITAIILFFAILSVDMYGMNLYRLLILSALTLSLVADAMLMLEVEKMTIYGMIYFLCAHIVYIFAFASGYSFMTWHAALALFFVCAILVFDAKVGRNNTEVRLLLFFYSAALCTAGFFALAGLSSGVTLSSVARASGALLFIVSDSFFAVNNFKKQIKHNSVITWATYAPAQFLFALSCF